MIASQPIWSGQICAYLTLYPPLPSHTILSHLFSYNLIWCHLISFDHLNNNWLWSNPIWSFVASSDLIVSHMILFDFISYWMSMNSISSPLLRSDVILSKSIWPHIISSNQIQHNQSCNHIPEHFMSISLSFNDWHQ